MFGGNALQIWQGSPSLSQLGIGAGICEPKLLMELASRRNRSGSRKNRFRLAYLGRIFANATIQNATRRSMKKQHYLSGSANNSTRSFNSCDQPWSSSKGMPALRASGP
jgi:hypothetical protein